MRAFISEETGSINSFVSLARWNWRRRRIGLRLRTFGRVVASCVTAIGACLIEALHESRSRSADRTIAQHRHLIQDQDGADSANRDMWPSGPVGR